MKNGTWLLAILFSMGCQSTPPPGETCVRASDCSSALTCQLGRCRTTFRTSHDCPLGARCLAGESGGVCSIDAEAHCAPCAAPLQCGSDQCRTQCLEDSECWAGTCDGTTCLEPISGDDAGLIVRDGGTDAGTPDAPTTPSDAGTDARNDLGVDASSDAGTDGLDDAGVDAP